MNFSGPDPAERMKQAERFVQSCNTGTAGEYRMWSGGSVTLYSSCFAAMTLHYLGALDSVSDVKRGAWLDYLRKWQEPSSGLFIGPELRSEELTSPKHDWEHVTMHLAAHVLPALELLGGSPDHPLHFARRFTDPRSLEAWLDARDWSDAWLEGNNLLFVGQFLIHLRNVEHVAEAGRALDLYFSWLDARIDPRTGLWGTNGYSSKHAAMCGAYHQLLVYEHENRQAPHARRRVDVTLGLQHADGGFRPGGGGGGACEDVDAVDILVNAYQVMDYRRPHIRRSLRRALRCVTANQMPDGGFVYRRDHPFIHLGIKATSAPANESNLFATWFRVHTLALISQVLTDEPIARIGWKFNTACSMGWHRPPAGERSRVTAADRWAERLTLGRVGYR